MTAIAYKDGLLAADTLVTEDGGWLRTGYVSKIARSPGGIAGGAAGTFSECQIFLNFISSGKVDAWAEEGFGDRIDFGGPPSQDFEAMLITPSGEVVLVDRHGCPIRGMVRPFFALGVHSILRGAMAAGADAVTAVKIAIQESTYCGGDVQAMRLGIPPQLPEGVALDDALQERERMVLETANAQGWDNSVYSVALEIRRRMTDMVDEGSGSDSGVGLYWPRSAPAPIDGYNEADLFSTIGGVEFHIHVHKSNAQLLKEGVTREQLGFPSPEGEPR